MLAVPPYRSAHCDHSMPAFHDDVIKWKFSALLAICAGNSPVPGEFCAQRPVTRSFDVFFDLPLNKRLSKHSWGWWFETLSGPLWRHSNECRMGHRKLKYHTLGGCVIVWFWFILPQKLCWIMIYAYRSTDALWGLHTLNDPYVQVQYN